MRPKVAASLSGFGLLVLAPAGAWWMADSVEQRLEQRAAIELEAAGLGDLEVDADGRTVRVSGRVPRADSAVAVERPVASLPPPPPARPPDRSLDGSDPQGELDRLLAAGTIDFDRYGDELTAAARATLDRVVEVLQRHPDAAVEVEGHTDSRGDPEVNFTLSRRRAAAVRSHLVEGGVAPDRVTAVGYGSENPIADNATAAGRRLNRRVEIRVLEPPSP